VRLRALTDSDVSLATETVSGRSGDLLLENEQVAFVISAGEHGSGNVGKPGGLLDAYLVEGGRRLPFDGLDELWPLINGAPVAAPAAELSQPDTSTLELRFAGPQLEVPLMLALSGADPELGPLEGEVIYRLTAGARSLEISISAENIGSEAVAVELGDFATFANDASEMFTLPAGFDHFSRESQVNAMGSAAEGESWAALSFASDPLLLVRDSSVYDQLHSGMTGVVRYDVARATLAPGEQLVSRHWLALGSDPAAVVAEMLAQQGQASVPLAGHVHAAGVAVPWARVSVFEDAECTRLVTRARANEQGAFAAQLAPGSYFLRASGRHDGEHVHVPGLTRRWAEGYGEQSAASRWVELGDSGEVAVELELEPAGRLSIEVLDAQGRPSPAKLTFQRDEPLPPPLLSAGERQPYADRNVAQVHWTLGGAMEARLPPGSYTVTASAGSLCPLAVTHDVQVTPSGATLRVVVPDHLGPRGYVAMDSHLHGADSGHGEVTRAERLITALAEGLDVALANDHDTIIDYAPLARELGIAEQLLTIPSAELTLVTGHHNPWPLTPQPDLPNGGAPRFWLDDPGAETRGVDALYADYAALGARVFQLNHGARYFEQAGYDPHTGTATLGPGFSFAFNAMELHNGKGNGGGPQLRRLWFSLLSWGRRVAPVAASDSHGRIPEAGTGRTYVWLGDGVQPTPSNLADAVLALRTVASSGPLVELLLADGTPALGRELQLAPGETVEVTARVWAPDWIPIAGVDLLVNGRVLKSWTGETTPALPPTVGADGLWLEQRVTLSPDRDSWYVLEAVSSADLSPVYPNLSPFAITAPLFLDADGTPGFMAPCLTGDCP
jgi:hypothetical protein